MRDDNAYLLDRCDHSGGARACWPWLLSTGSHGYGNAFDGTTVTVAHRLAYRTWVGPIPKNRTVDHRCRLRICINPRHLRLLTNAANARDNGQLHATHCRNGHRWTKANTRIQKRKNARDHRLCVTCLSARE